MVRPADVITDCLWRPTPDEDGPGVGDFGRQRFGIGRADLKVLRRDPVGQRHRFIKIPHRDHRAKITLAGPGNRPAFQRFKAFVHGLRHRLPERGIISDQDRLCAFVMFGLR